MTNIDEEIKGLITSIKSYNESFNFKKLRQAIEFAKVAHIGTKRLSGEDQMIHPVETAKILASWKMDEDTIIAGILHDTVEHGAAMESDIEKAFGPSVLELVKGVTKVSKLKLVGNSDEVFVENLRKMFLAIAKDLRVVFLRLAERIDNLRTLESLPEVRRKNYAIDSLEIYSPLAERLGMWEVKSEIDDLAFRYAYPKEYKDVVNVSIKYYRDAQERIDIMRKKLLKNLKQSGISNFQLKSRKKGYYSLWKKLQRPDIENNIENVLDIIAMRIMVERKIDCYEALGILHSFYKPAAGLAISDFIAAPKPNGYQSIHTKVFGPKRKIVEVQIRTYEMHEEAERGVSAHWQMSQLKLKGKMSSSDIDKGTFKVDDKLHWVKELVNWQKEIKNNEEFLKAVKFDALSRRIFVFSPKGDVYDLPEGSTPVDFAFSVHTDLGLSIKNALVDGKIVPLNFQLQNGQVVEISKSKNPNSPNSDWLDFAKTTLARREIKKRLRKRDDEAILN